MNTKSEFATVIFMRRLIDDLDLSKQNGVVRVSLVHYNTLEEVNHLIEVFDKVL